MPPLLRPPLHRGPLLAAGATVLTVGVVLQQMRIGDLAPGAQAAICLALATLMLWLAAGSPLEGGRPPAHQSVLIVCGLVNLVPGLVHLGEALGADYDSGFPPGTGLWISLATSGLATLLAVRRNSGIAALAAAVAGGSAVLFAADWVADPEPTAYRWLLLIIATVLVVLSLVLRGARPRQSEQLVNAAGLAILGIPATIAFAFAFGVFTGISSPELGGLWELVLLAAGFGLAAYAAADRAPGPGYIGAANLFAFAIFVSQGADRTLKWWPLILLAVGALMLVAGLRPARPLPPEPEGYRRDELPLSARVEGGEQVFTVRD